MSNPKPPDDPEHPSYDLDLEEDAARDAERVMREAVQAVDARSRPAAARSEATSESAQETGDLEEGEGEEDEPMLVARLEEEIADLRERSVRTLADFENYRRRVERERSEHRRYAGAEALSEFLAVVDNLDRALQAKGSETDLRLGVEMIHRQMLDLLQRFGVKPVLARDLPFDPLEHEAVVRLESSEVDQPTVIEELQRGYRLHDRLLRPAMVKVAVPVEHSAIAPRSREDVEK
jgi:molecular chaperone GrpE